MSADICIADVPVETGSIRRASSIKNCEELAVHSLYHIKDM